MPLAAQIERIRTKLPLARKADPAHLVFGSNAHRYELGPTLTEAQVFRVEILNQISLPECYRAFLLEIGNGGSELRRPGAGPFYGLFTLKASVELSNPIKLARPFLLSPDMTPSDWRQFKESQGDALEADTATKQHCAWDRSLNGVLPIGAQARSAYHGLILNGPHTGRIVNFSDGLERPKFAYEATFLDWYERWLDEVMAGYLQHWDGYKFGYLRAGDDIALMNAFDQAEAPADRIEFLAALSKLKKIETQTLDRLETLASAPNVEVQRQAIEQLARFDFKCVESHLAELISSDDEGLSLACRLIIYFGKERASDYVDKIARRPAEITDSDTFSMIAGVMHAARADWSDMLRNYCESPDISIRKMAFTCLGQHPTAVKARNIDRFMMGLSDDAPRVVHATLQAVAGLEDPRLHPSFESILERFSTDEEFILTNLDHRLREHGFANRNQFLDARRKLERQAAKRPDSAAAF